jgi:hypothetical protein
MPHEGWEGAGGRTAAFRRVVVEGKAFQVKTIAVVVGGAADE